MSIKFTALFSGTLSTHTSAKKFQGGEIWLDPEVAFKRSFMCDGVYQVVVEIHRVKQCGRPELGVKAGHVQKCPNFDCKMAIININGAILRRAVCTSWINHIVKIT
jgi:hypothetical protein